MTESFTDILLIEAVARRVRVTLIAKPGHPGQDGRFVTRLLAADAVGRLVLEVPTFSGRRVFVPTGSPVGLAFSLGLALIQARTTVRDHCQYRLQPTQRVDSILVDRPGNLIFGGERAHARTRVDPSACVPASLWLMGTFSMDQPLLVRDARLLDHSLRGFGIRVSEPLTWPKGAEVLIRLEEPLADAHRIFVGVLVRCDVDAETGLWVAGFDQVVEMRPGESHLAELINEAAEDRRPTAPAGTGPAEAA